MKKHKSKIIAAAIVFAVLTAAFFVGGSPDNNNSVNIPVEQVPEEQLSISTPEKPEKTELSQGRSDKPEQQEGTIAPEKPVDTMKPADAQLPQTQESNPVAEKDQYHTDPVPEGKPAPVEPQEAEVTNATYTCTISISCATILNNLDDLDPEKVDIVPADGWILQPVTVSFNESESVFDVLMRICREKKIHMEFMDTPIYNSAYIEGIANLYEFDCGPLSGWMYKVNEWFPNYGCSRYALKDGDIVCWVYTCDLGADVGDNSMGGQRM